MNLVNVVQKKVVVGYQSKNRPKKNKSCRARRELQELSEVIFQETASLSHKSQNTFPEPAVWNF
jgi:hypothetical protein